MAPLSFQPDLVIKAAASAVTAGNGRKEKLKCSTARSKLHAMSPATGKCPWKHVFLNAATQRADWNLTERTACYYKRLSLFFPYVFAYTMCWLCAKRWCSTALSPAVVVFVAACNSPQLQCSYWAGSKKICCGCSDKLSGLRMAERLNKIKGD